MAAPRFPSEVTLANAGEALAAARACCAASSVDLGPLARFDSAAVAVLVALRREFGAALRLGNPPPNLRKLASLYGVDELLFGARA
jgi:ABC-type transporter Mla MlaB component